MPNTVFDCSWNRNQQEAILILAKERSTLHGVDLQICVTEIVLYLLYSVLYLLKTALRSFEILATFNCRFFILLNYYPYQSN